MPVGVAIVARAAMMPVTAATRKPMVPTASRGVLAWNMKPSIGVNRHIKTTNGWILRQSGEGNNRLLRKSSARTWPLKKRFVARCEPNWFTVANPPFFNFGDGMKNWPAFLVIIAFSALGVVGDYLLKLSSACKNPFQSKWFYLGFAVYASTAFGWVFVMRHLKLATIGVVYSVSMILLLTAIGVVVFREPISAYEFVGLLLAVASLFLLMRFA